MPITATCQSCQKQYRLPDEWAGRTAKCKGCGQPMKIPAAAQGGSQPAAPRAAAGPSCPICDSAMQAGTCTVCGYSEQASKTLAPASVPVVAAPAKKGGKVKVKAAKEGDGSGSAQKMMILGAVGAVVLLVVIMVGLMVAQFRAHVAKQEAHERLDALFLRLADTREASLTNSADWGSDVDLKKLLTDGAADLARELPYLPTYLEPLEDKEGVKTNAKKQWVRDLLQNMPAGTDLSPLEDIPSTSFAYETAQKVLGGS